MRAICDATALIYLLRIREEDLLAYLFEELIIPDEVIRELAERPKEVERLSKLPCITLSEVDMSGLEDLPDKYAHLHAGEVSVMKLAHHLEVDKLVIDDLTARIAAAELGFQVIGLLGILLLLRKSGGIRDVRSYADRAIDAGYRVNDDFYVKFLTSIGETPK